MKPRSKHVTHITAPIAADKVSELQRHAYLQSKGINPKQPMQLDLIFSETVNASQRLIPNDYARSSLFTVRNKRTPRRTMQNETLFHLHEGVSIEFTGIELRAEDDELVWLQILHYAKSVPMGQQFSFRIGQLVQDIGWAKSGQNYDNARESLSRLRANEVLVRNTKAYGSSGSLSLIQQYGIENDSAGRPCIVEMKIDPNLMVLFAGNNFTNHSWEIYRSLTPTARRLADYFESHRVPFPLHIEKFREMCCSSTTRPRDWRSAVAKACGEVEKAGLVKTARLSPEDMICIVK